MNSILILNIIIAGIALLGAIFSTYSLVKKRRKKKSSGIST